MRRYASGYRLERRVQKLYMKNGWLVTRFPNSGRQLHPADILAVKRYDGGTQIHLIECKNASKENEQKTSIYLEIGQIKKLLDAAHEHNALALVAYSFPRQHVRIAHANQLKSSGKMLCIHREDGVPIQNFLKQCL